MYLKSQNSGVLVKDDENAGNLDYFGVLTYIVKLSQSRENNVALFKCDRWDVSFKKDTGQTNMDSFLLIVIVN